MNVLKDKILDKLEPYLRKPRKYESYLSAGIFLLCLAVLFIWLTSQGDETINERQARVPSVTAMVSATNDIDIQAQTAQKVAAKTEQQISNDIADNDQVSPIKDPDFETSSPVSDEPIEVDMTGRDTASQRLNAYNNERGPVSESELNKALENSNQQDKDAQWQQYAKKTGPLAPNKSRIAIVLQDIGFQTSNLGELLNIIHENTTLSLNPYNQEIMSTARYANTKNFEMMVMMPMEPRNYPVADPGPQALLTTLSRSSNMQRANWVLERFDSYIGVSNHMGGAFLRQSKGLEPVFDILAERGLIFLNTLGLEKNIGERTAEEKKAPYISVDLVVDEILIEEDIQRQLQSLELLSQEFGYAIGLLNPYPLSIKQYQAWAKTLESKNIEIVPLSHLFFYPPNKQ